MADENVIAAPEEEQSEAASQEQYVILEEEPQDGEKVGRTTVLTDDVADLLMNGRKDGKTYNVEASKSNPLGPAVKGKAKLLDKRRDDDPLVCFLRNLANHLDALNTKSNLKFIYLVGAGSLSRFFERLENRFIPKNSQALKDSSFEVSDLLRLNKRIDEGKSADPLKVDWKYLDENFGVKADELIKNGQLSKLLNFQQTDALKVTLPPSEGFEKGFETKARFSLRKDERGGYSIHHTFYAKEVDLSSPFMGHEWTPEEREKLSHDGNLGKVIDLTKNNGEINSHYVSIDPQTNRLSIMNANYLRLPKHLSNKELTKEQFADLKSGKMVRLDNLLRKDKNGEFAGKPYSTYVQVNAEKKGLEFIFDPNLDYKQRFEKERNRLKEEQFAQERFAGIPKKIYGKELSDKQRDALGYGQPLKLDGLKRKDGKTFSVYVQVNEEGELRMYNKDPRYIHDVVNKAAASNGKKQEVNRSTKNTQKTGNTKEKTQTQSSTKQAAKKAARKVVR